MVWQWVLAPRLGVRCFQRLAAANAVGEWVDQGPVPFSPLALANLAHGLQRVRRLVALSRLGLGRWGHGGGRGWV